MKPWLLDMLFSGGRLRPLLYCHGDHLVIPINIKSGVCKSGAPDASYFQTLGTLLLKGSELISTVLIIVFSLGALMLYYLFYRSKLIPRWISVWGFIASLLIWLQALLIIIPSHESVFDDQH